MKRLKVAVVGAGHLGRIHARLLSGIDRVELVGVVDPVEEVRRHVAQQYATRALADHGELIGQVDAAIVATPTRDHHAVALDLLNRGIHLLVEKPLASTLAEADQLVDAARAGGVVLQVGHVERFNPALAAAKPHVGQPKYIDAIRTSPYTLRSTDIGVVLDLMIHDLDVVLTLVGSPIVAVEALGISLLGGAEDMAQARLTFASGCVANLSASRTSFHAARKMQVFGDRAFVGLDFAEPSAMVIRPSDKLRACQVNTENLSAEEKDDIRNHLFTHLLPMQPIELERRNALLDELHDFVDSVTEPRVPRVSGEDGQRALAVAEQILSSIASHQWDGSPAGRVGPMAAIAAPILRGPHWHASSSPETDDWRKAG